MRAGRHAEAGDQAAGAEGAPPATGRSGHEVLREPRWPVRALRSIVRLYRSLSHENLPLIITLAVGLMLVGAVVVYVFERTATSAVFANLFDSLWWSVVTYTTVGYGDKVPQTVPGRVFSMVMMLAGLVVTSVVSGTIASIFVDRKIREGRGLQDVVAKSHVVICGWNSRAENIVDGLSRVAAPKQAVVLVNENDPETMQELSARFKSLDIRFVRGDFTNERVLRRASIESARAAILVTDESGAQTASNADERIILTALAINAISDDISVSAELVNPDNEQHLRRAHVEDIIVAGEFNGFLHATATQAPGIPLLVKELLRFGSGCELREVAVPGSYVGRTFAELATFYLSERQATLVGLLSVEKQMSLDDMLSEGTSSIDDFIKRKFAEAEIGLFDDEKPDRQLLLNPGAEYVVRDTDTAFVIATSD